MASFGCRGPAVIKACMLVGRVGSSMHALRPEPQIVVAALNMGCKSIEIRKSELRKTTTKAAPFSSLLSVSSLKNEVQTSTASILNIDV